MCFLYLLCVLIVGFWVCCGLFDCGCRLGFHLGCDVVGYVWSVCVWCVACLVGGCGCDLFGWVRMWLAVKVCFVLM